ncbi:MAG TPA: carbamoyltransferase C-terminal domain-containing protein [Acidimicrobiales bacterium]|nr:carbamoyltransferase C-terminal domain-containing protein [Acidimicrobiales bacterium]
MGGGRTGSGVFLGIFEGHFDPAVAAVRDGRVVAYAEEERPLRYKHAPGLYPTRALSWCLEEAGVRPDEVEAVAVNWNVPAYTDGTMRVFFEELRQRWPVDPATVAWQEAVLRRFDADSLRRRHERHFRRAFGELALPPLHPVPHHYTHAFHALMQSPFERAVCLTIDGSGDQHTAVLWRKEGEGIEPLREIVMPHSLGWVYAAFTEYLGFDAYDGEHKVMGLAAYGRPRDDLRARLARIVGVAADGVEFRVDPSFIHYGPHTCSDRYTDRLVDLLGRPPRRPGQPLTPWHEDVAYALQECLEEAVERLVVWAVRETGIAAVCIGGGVGLNVKLNSRLFQHPEIGDLFAHPLCSDGGAAAGAALAACWQATGARPERLETLALGPAEATEDIERALRVAHLDYERPEDICDAVADELARERVVGWFQGRMEAGPRALGQRSILADPRRVEMRDKVNAIVKFREYWRPFCPSMPAEAAARYFERHTDAPFMILALPANDCLRRDAPAVVHVDGSCRVQLVHERVLPRYHRLLTLFEKRTGVPVLLNTSFNVKGEPIVCTIQDALRTFWSTGLEVLAAGDFLLRKPGVPP